MCNNCNHNHCNCNQSCNQSNTTFVVPVTGAGWIEEYRLYHPEDTRTDQEIIDSVVKPASANVPDTTPSVPIAYDAVWLNELLLEMRAIKTALINAGYMEPEV